MPFGLQLMGRLNGDAALLGAALALERTFEGDALMGRPRPDLHALRQPQPALRAIVTHPPLGGELAAGAEAVSPV